MFDFNRYPFTNFHEPNSNWLLTKLFKFGSAAKEAYDKAVQALGLSQQAIDTSNAANATANEAKERAEAAETAATNAEQSAAASAASAQESETKATEAAASAAQAAASSASAAADAQAASTAAINAAASATQAASDAQDAATAATAAQAAATDAQSKVTAAETAATNAAASAAAAETAATNAEQSAGQVDAIKTYLVGDEEIPTTGDSVKQQLENISYYIGDENGNIPGGTTLSERVDSLESESSTLFQRTNSLMNSSAQNANDITALTTRVSSNETSIINANAEISGLDTRVETLEDDINKVASTVKYYPVTKLTESMDITATSFTIPIEVDTLLSYTAELHLPVDEDGLAGGTISFQKSDTTGNYLFNCIGSYFSTFRIVSYPTQNGSVASDVITTGTTAVDKYELSLSKNWYTVKTAFYEVSIFFFMNGSKPMIFVTGQCSPYMTSPA